MRSIKAQLRPYHISITESPTAGRVYRVEGPGLNVAPGFRTHREAEEFARRLQMAGREPGPSYVVHDPASPLPPTEAQP